MKYGYPTQGPPVRPSRGGTPPSAKTPPAPSLKGFPPITSLIGPTKRPGSALPDAARADQNSDQPARRPPERVSIRRRRARSRRPSVLRPLRPHAFASCVSSRSTRAPSQPWCRARRWGGGAASSRRATTAPGRAGGSVRTSPGCSSGASGGPGARTQGSPPLLGSPSRRGGEIHPILPFFAPFPARFCRSFLPPSSLHHVHRLLPPWSVYRTPGGFATTLPEKFRISCRRGVSHSSYAMPPPRAGPPRGPPPLSPPLSVSPSPSVGCAPSLMYVLNWLP